MKSKDKNLKSLDQFIDEQYGKRGIPERENFEERYEIFKMGALIHEARVRKGMTQEELAIKVGTTKSYISRIENNVKEVRMSTLQKIVEKGLGGKVRVSIEF
ncbi:MAG: XRE family transcriptional regulator [Chitinophagaceae bacterium]|nr:MAG: XRE family transcriptional regulator [Chitinophagaceae bacterium]